MLLQDVRSQFRLILLLVVKMDTLKIFKRGPKPSQAQAMAQESEIWFELQVGNNITVMSSYVTDVFLHTIRTAG